MDRAGGRRRSSVLFNVIEIVDSPYISGFSLFSLFSFLLEMKSIATSSKYGYTDPAVWERPYTHSGSSEWALQMLLEVQASSDAHIWLSNGERLKTKGYEIVLGASRNKASFIRRGQQGSELAAKYHDKDDVPLSGSRMDKFWIVFIYSSGQSSIAVGRGWIPRSDMIFFAIDSSSKRLDVNSVFVSTGFGSEGRWTIVSVTAGPVRTAFECPKREEVEIVTPAEVVVEQPASPKAKTGINVQVKKASTATPIRNTIVVKRGLGSSPGSLLKRQKIDPSQSARFEISIKSSETERNLVKASVDQAIARFNRRKK